MYNEGRAGTGTLSEEARAAILLPKKSKPHPDPLMKPSARQIIACSYKEVCQLAFLFHRRAAPLEKPLGVPHAVETA